MITPEFVAPWVDGATAILAGIALGAMFFGGLWWTVRQVALLRRPGLGVFISLTLRMGLTLAGFFAVAQGRWQRLLFCLLGFLLARAGATWLTRRDAA